MKPESLSLQQLIIAAAHGDHASFAQIYARTHLHLFGVAVRMLRTQHQAEDVMQEAFVSIWKSASTYQADAAAHEGHAMAWLTSVVRNKALDALRSTARRKEDPLVDTEALDDDTADLPGDAARSAMDMFAQAARDLQVDHCMQALDGSHRQSLALAYYHGLSHNEVAAQMGAPLGSVKAWIRRGLSKLKDCLAAQGVAA